MAFIGMGLQNRSLLGNFLGQNVKVVAVCDVDTTRREHALKIVQEFHAGNPQKGAFGCKSYADFREIIARKDIDAVCIATPVTRCGVAIGGVRFSMIGLRQLRPSHLNAPVRSARIITLHTRTQWGRFPPYEGLVRMSGG